MSENDVRLAKEDMVHLYFSRIRRFVAGEGVRPRFADYSPEGNVVGVGVAEKVSMARLTGSLAVRVYVKEKAPLKDLLKRQRIPSSISGVPVDVVAIGQIVAGAGPPPTCGGACSEDRKSRIRPAPCGVSCGHQDITAGTIGAVVCGTGQDASRLYILSNNHVLANSNQGRVGQPILQPGPFDGGKAKDKIGELAGFCELDFSGGANEVDAALASVRRQDVLNEICLIGPLQGQASPRRGMTVVKHGRTTGKTQGVIEDVDADIWVDYQPQGTGFFKDAVAVRGAGVTPTFSSGGDSGSVIVEESSSKACALLFAGSDVLTFGNQIDRVMRKMKVSLCLK